MAVQAAAAGDPLIDGLAGWFAGPLDDRYWWSITLQLLDQAEHRSVEIAEAVQKRLRGNEDATARLLASRLASVAGAHGWLPG